MENQDLITNHESESKWRRVERGLLIFTFLASVLGTYYSVRTSKLALQEGNIELRPWINISEVNSFFHRDSFEAKATIFNFGKVPAFVSIRSNAALDGVAVNNANNPRIQTVIMPGEEFRYGPLMIKGDSFKEMQQGKVVSLTWDLLIRPPYR